MSHKLRFAIRLVLTLFVSPALAQPAAKPAPPQPGTSDALTPEQAKRALETLQDDKKRGEIINTLRAIANASPQSAQPAPEQQSPIPLSADSLGAQLLLMVSEQVGEMSREVADVARTLTHFPAFYYWFLRTANDPAAYGLLIDIAWKLALVLGCALAAEWVVFRLIKRPVAFLEARLPQTARVPVQALASTRQTSILTSMCGSLCDAVVEPGDAGLDDGQAMLEALEAMNLFVIPLDDRRQWYRYHHLFADVVNLRLKHLFPQQLPELHRRASLWYEQNAMISEATHHAIMAGNQARAAQLVEQHGCSLLMRGEGFTLLKWVEAVAPYTHTHPWLSILKSWGLRTHRTSGSSGANTPHG